MVDVINVKCELGMTSLPTQTHGFFPEYHMNKKYRVRKKWGGVLNQELPLLERGTEYEQRTLF